MRNSEIDLKQLIKNNPGTFWYFFSSIALSCTGLLITSLFETSLLIYLSGWALVFIGIIISWKPLKIMFHGKLD